MKAWLFQDTRQKHNLGNTCPWSVGWFGPDGKKRSKRIGCHSVADKYSRKIEGQFAAGGRTRAKAGSSSRRNWSVSKCWQPDETKEAPQRKDINRCGAFYLNVAEAGLEPARGLLPTGF